MDDSIERAIRERVEQEGFARKVGLELVGVGPGYALVEMVPKRDDENIFGMVHGGAIFSLMDEAFQVSCNSHGTVAVALCVNVVYHNPPEGGVRLRAESKEIHRSNKTATYRIQVTDADERLIASCQAVAYRKGRKLPFLETPA